MTVRKNFLLDESVVKHLETLAQKEKSTQTDIIKDMIEERYRQYTHQEKLKALKSMTLMPEGSLVDQSVQSIKASMNA